MIEQRGLFRDSKPSNASCPIPKGVQDLHLEGSSHTPMLLLSLACTAVTLASSITLITFHLRRYRAPKEQRQIIRILFAPFVFAIVSLAEILDYRIAVYIDPISELYEAFCLCGLYLLYIQFATPAGTFGEDMFMAMKQAEETNKQGNARWPKISWIAVFQFPITDIIAIIILEATEASGTYCANSLSPKFGHLWSEILRSVGVGAAVVAIFRFYGRMKKLMKARRGFYKLLCFKLIVGVRFLQTWVISILISKQVIKTSSSFTYGDLVYGVPNTLMCVETVLFSAAFWYAFSSTEYSSNARRSERMPIWRAVFDAMNPYDLLHGIVKVFVLLAGGKVGGKSSPSFQTRTAKGRYQTLDGMESLSRPAVSHERHASDQSYYGGASVMNPAMYQPPEGSPPEYDPSKSYLMADARPARSPSPSGMEMRRERDMV